METQQNSTNLLPEKPLYHYSSPGGLLGMMESKSIWMSNIRYQNDSKEYDHIFDVLIKLIKEEYPGLDLEQQIAGEKDRELFVPSIFTFSLTEEKDLLSQWRGYCPKGGYCFSFDRTQLNAFVKKFGLSIQKCVYEEAEQKKIIREEVIRFSPKDWEEMNSGSKEKGSEFMYGMKYIRNRLARLAPLLKHHAFAEEVEWRLVKDFDRASPEIRPLEQHPAFSRSKISEVSSEGQFFKFREDMGMLIPYLSLPLVDLADPYQSVTLSEVIIAPGTRHQLAKSSCEAMLNSWGVNCPVNFSSVPYREK